MSLPRDLKLTLVRSLDDASALKRWLSQERSYLGVDTETGGLRWWCQDLRLVQLGDARRAWAVPAAEWGGLVKELLTSYEGPMVMHNAKFDGHFIERHLGIKLPWDRVHDTRVAAHLLEARTSTALKNLSVRYVDQHAASGQDRLKQAMHDGGWDWGTVPVDLEAYWAYGALDAALTSALADVLLPRVLQHPDLRRVYDLELACQRAVSRMEERGIRCDLEYTELKREEFRTYCDRSRDWAKKTYDVNIGSSRQVADALVRQGAPLTKRTATGQLALDADILRSVDHELARTTLTVRQLEKLTATYLDTFLDLEDDGYLHASVNILGARTGRMSISEPPLQTLPRDHDENPAAVAVRNALMASEDHKLVLIDFDQIEQRLLAHFAHDEGMMKAFARGGDFFTTMAQQIYDDHSLVKSDPRRQLTKNAAYAKAYGAGPAKFALTAGIPEEGARAFLDAYDTTFPGVRAFQRAVERTAKERLETEGEGYVHSPIGRRHVADNGQEYKLVNYLIQGTAADVLKRKIVDLDLKGLGDYMVLPVHDEIVLDVPDDEDFDAVVKEAEETMQETTDFRVPLTVGVKIVARWGDAYA